MPTYNVLGRTKAGAPIWLNISVIVPLECHGSVCTVHLFRDATHQLRYETYVEQILWCRSAVVGPQQTMAQRALPATPSFMRLSTREKQDSRPHGPGQGGAGDCRDPGDQLCHGAKPSPDYPAQIRGAHPAPGDQAGPGTSFRLSEGKRMRSSCRTVAAQGGRNFAFGHQRSLRRDPRNRREGGLSGRKPSLAVCFRGAARPCDSRYESTRATSLSLMRRLGIGEDPN